MVEIRPFRGVRYNKEKIGDLGLVITPPYDVINEKERDKLYALSEYIFIKLILAKNEEDGKVSNKYARAAGYFKEWQEKGILKRDEEDSVYIYSQEFTHKDKAFVRTGFISLVKLEEEGKGVLPHEKTLEKPLKDRLALLDATSANLGCVFVIYDDKKRIIDSIIKDKTRNNEPDFDFKDMFGIRHRLWRISDDKFIKGLIKEMGQYQCVIADGHHRYKSALRFKERHPELDDAGYAMCCFANSYNEGFFVLPVDRFVFNLKDIDVDDVLGRLKGYFDVDEVEDVNKLIQRVEETKILIDKTINLKNHVFGMYCFLNQKSYFLKLKNDKGDVGGILEQNSSDSNDIYKKLDINILHRLIFEDVLGISEEDQFKGSHIEYAKGNKRALDKLDDDKYQFAFFINAPLMREIFLTARAGETMPQKSTYFYPKVYSGLVINKIEE